MACVFRVFGDNLEIDALLEKLNMEPYRLWRKGEPRNWRFPEGKKSECSGACFTASDAEMWEFPIQVEETTEFLKMHEKDIKTIVAFPNAEAALDFGIELKRDFLNCDYLPPELLRLAGNLGIGIELSHYAPTEEEDQIEEQS
ncbi:DUF4279 domain-containing protein [Geobacter sp. AOG1]|uniref:DUF4279 domain-containing protein n=1 Tax=Geobacter sp. AOG1 TaxID=1566346 RepID=UPI001CC3B2A1|nr:DUF4279 domain-containing protein [Geobacter sp. AOG1]GFE58738.1 hypothetical protein AOG1_26180 [Geobacter sp. AOG1]